MEKDLDFLMGLVVKDLNFDKSCDGTYNVFTCHSYNTFLGGSNRNGKWEILNYMNKPICLNEEDFLQYISNKFNNKNLKRGNI